MLLKWVGIAVLLLALAALAATVWKVDQRRAEAARAFPPDGDFVEVGGHPVHVVEIGLDRGAGPDLVLLHGASGNTRDFTFDLAHRLAPDYRVLIMDRPGLGHTPALAKSGVTIADQAALLSGAAMTLGAKRPVVVGQSFGGAVTMAWAVHHPDRIAAAVSLAGATYPWDGDLDAFHKRLAHPVMGPILAHLISAWASQDYVATAIRGIFAPQAAPEGYAVHVGVPLVLRPESLIANAQQRTDLRPELRALAPRYKELTLPVEIVHGTADTIVGLHVHSTRMVDDIPGAALDILDGAGHMPQHTHPDRVIAAIHRAATRAGLR